jgi:DUF4097 and DUF4098 domain-containing protein YvlB
MKGIKGLLILGIVLLIVGITGIVLTYNTEKEDVAEGIAISDAPFNTIDIDTNNAKVEVIATNDTDPSVELTGSRPKSKTDKLTADVADGKLSVKLNEHQRKLFNFDFGQVSLTLNVYIPNKQYDALKITNDNGKISMNHLNVKKIEAETANGRLEMKDITGSKLITRTDNGRIHAADMKVADVNMNSGNGTIELAQVEAVKTQAETDNGKIILSDVVGELTGKTNNGRISLVTNDLERPIELETDNGRIEIVTSKKPENVTFDVSVDNGKVNIFNESKDNRVIGNGDHLIKLTTKNGRITVK